MANKLTQSFITAVGAGFAGIWIRSREHVDALRTCMQACADRNWLPLSWNPEEGTRTPENAPTKPPDDLTIVTALRCLRNNADALEKAIKDARPGEHDKLPGHSLLFVRNLRSALYGSEAKPLSIPLQLMQRTIEQWASKGAHLVVLAYEHESPPPELAAMFHVIEHPLPDEDERWDIITQVETDADQLPHPKSDDGRKLIHAAAGMTRTELEGAVGLALAEQGSVKPETLWRLKTESLGRDGILTVAPQDGPGFDSLGGLDPVKAFLLRLFNSPQRNAKIRPKGVGMLGVPGAGKTVLVDALGREVGWPVLHLDMGATRGKYVGDSENKLRSALHTADEMDRVILYVDEIDKAMASAGSSGDSGVGASQLGILQTWLSTRKSNVFFMFSSNNLQNLMETSSGALFRAERIDAIFFFDLLTPVERASIWQIHLRGYGHAGTAKKAIEMVTAGEVPDQPDFMGAEVEQVCRLAALLDMPLAEAAKMVVPSYETAREQIDGMREQADQRYLSANYPGVFDKLERSRRLAAADNETASGRPRRVVNRGKA